MSKRITQAIKRLHPEAQFVVRGDQIEWHSQDIPQPTQEEINASLVVIDGLAYKDLRAAEYPPITDYLDGVVKGDQAQIDSYIAACQAVKAKYPKV